MRIELSNIGKIKTADVLINGITVIAGENNTGKSTVGKALYAIFNSFFEVKNELRKEKLSSINNSLVPVYIEFFGESKFTLSDVDHLADSLLNKFKNENATSDNVTRYIADELHIEVSRLYKSDLRNYIEKTVAALNVSAADYIISLAQKNFDEEFNQQINNALEEKTASVALTIKDYRSSVRFEDNIVANVEKNIDVITDAIYLDDPFIIDEKPPIGLFPLVLTKERYHAHKSKLKYLIYNNSRYNSIVDEVVVQKRLQNILQKLNSACHGKIFFKNNGELMYQQDNANVAYKVANLSTGLKTFAIMQSLLLNGVIKDKGLVILDEPEIHLHPEWQLIFAELIVMLQKEFGLHILLNTHSPYFLQAIEVFAEKYAVSDGCEYYLSYNEIEESYVERVTGNVEKIYAKLAKPLQTLERLRYADDV